MDRGEQFNFLAQHGMSEEEQKAAQLNNLHDLAHMHASFREIYKNDSHPDSPGLAEDAWHKWADATMEYKKISGKHLTDDMGRCTHCNNPWSGKEPKVVTAAEDILRGTINE